MIGILTDAELESIRTGADPKLTTEFLNGGTFGEREIKAYPHNLRKTYYVEFSGPTEVDSIEFYALDDDTAQEYLAKKYDLDNYPIAYLGEITTTIREIEIEEPQDQWHCPSVRLDHDG